MGPQEPVLGLQLPHGDPIALHGGGASALVGNPAHSCLTYLGNGITLSQALIENGPVPAGGWRGEISHISPTWLRNCCGLVIRRCQPPGHVQNQGNYFANFDCAIDTYLVRICASVTSQDAAISSSSTQTSLYAIDFYVEEGNTINNLKDWIHGTK